MVSGDDEMMGSFRLQERNTEGRCETLLQGLKWLNTFFQKSAEHRMTSRAEAGAPGWTNRLYKRFEIAEDEEVESEKEGMLSGVFFFQGDSDTL